VSEGTVLGFVPVHLFEDGTARTYDTLVRETAEETYPYGWKRTAMLVLLPRGTVEDDGGFCYDMHQDWQPE
jgi:hypothetical protein